jgi:hypothetical protein
MSTSHAQVVVAGHICLDIIPTLEAQQGGLLDLSSPRAGRLPTPAWPCTGSACQPD